MQELMLIGNIGRVPEIKTLQDGKEIMNFSVAVNGKDDKVTWFGIVANAQPKLLPYLTKGRQVMVRGTIRVAVYKDQPDITCYADTIRLLGKNETEQEEKKEEPEKPTYY